MAKKELTKQEKVAAIHARNRRLQILMFSEKLHEENRKLAKAAGGGAGFEAVKPMDGGLMGKIGKWTDEVGALRGQISKSRDLYRKKGKEVFRSR